MQKHNLNSPHRSMLKQILLWASLILCILAIIAGVVSYIKGYKEIYKFQSSNLQNIATLIAEQEKISNRQKVNKHYNTDYSDGGIIVDIFYQSNPQQAPLHQENSQDILTWQQLATIPKGISSQWLAHDKHAAWQTFRLDDGDMIIVIRQNGDVMQDISEHGALQSTIPLILALILFMLMLAWLIKKMFRPVQTLSTHIAQRPQHDLTPLDIKGLPLEILPFVESINQLLAQSEAYIQQQQRFIADASHELRSPLTAISLQLQRLQRVAQDEKMQDGLDKLALRVQRNQDLVEQLLALARTNNSPQQQNKGKEPCDHLNQHRKGM